MVLEILVITAAQGLLSKQSPVTEVDVALAVTRVVQTMRLSRDKIDLHVVVYELLRLNNLTEEEK